MPKVSVVIPTLNRARTLATTLDRIERQTVPPDLYEVLIVDNNSTDGTQAMLRQKAAVYPNLTVCFQPKPGAAAARNKGLRRSSGEIVLFIDDDIFAEPDLIEAHLLCRDENPRASIVGKVLPPWDSSTDPFLRYLRDAGIFSPYSFAAGRPMDFSDFHTGNVSAMRKDLLAVGGFNELFFLYGMEDIELGYRLQKLGCPVMPGDKARARHEYFPTPMQFLTKCQQAGYSLGMLIELHPELRRRFMGGGRFTRLFRRFYHVYSMLVSALQPFSRCLPGWEGFGKRAVTFALEKHFALAIRCRFFQGYQEYLRSAKGAVPIARQPKECGRRAPLVRQEAER